MARSSLIAIALLVAACNPPKPQPTPPSAAPVPREYSCDANRNAAKEFRTLPPTSVLRSWIDDYRIERKALRAFHQLPEPAPCPAAEGPVS